MKNTLYTLICFILTLTTGRASAQEAITLRIGDTAPPLKYSQWIKGQPIDHFKEDHMYIVEFWATWCGPCIAQMPHLSLLAEKYQGKVTFIGASVWEKTGDKAYETSLPKVTRFVEGNSKNMRYDVLADTKDQFIANNWLKPAGINGIPTTIIIQKNKIVWIGHPAALEEIIDPLLEGTYDIAANKAVYDARVEAAAKADEEDMKRYKTLIDAIEAKKYNRILDLVDSLISTSPEEKSRLGQVRFEALLKVDQQKAFAQAQEMIKENEGIGVTIAQTISDQDGLSKELYLLGVSQLKKVEPMMSMALNAIALMESKMQNYPAAVDAQKKALALAKEELKDPNYVGRVFDYTIRDYENQLNDYLKKLEKNSQ